MLKTAYLSLGSNLGDRHSILEQALQELSKLLDGHLKISPLYETPALLPQNAPIEWDLPYLNLVVEVKTTLSPLQLLNQTQQIEALLKRTREKTWQPRTLDIDILYYENVKLNEPRLTLPHPELARRAFVLCPLKDLNPHLRLSDERRSVLEMARDHKEFMPLIMGIINLTPDSFSDGGELFRLEDLESHLDNVDKSVSILDIGAESTRPGATPLIWDEEWRRLEPGLKLISKRYANRRLRPKLSVDTRHAEVAARALEYGVDIINDVSGASSNQLLEVVAKSKSEYVLMHSLSVPADKNFTLADDVDATKDILNWMRQKLDLITSKGIEPNKVLIDPGIGFGKTSRQSADLLANIKQFYSLGCRVLVGHSRKSFLNTLTSKPFAKRDNESLALSIKLGFDGVDILRVHNPLLHHEAWRTVNWVRSKEREF